MISRDEGSARVGRGWQGLARVAVLTPVLFLTLPHPFSPLLPPVLAVEVDPLRLEITAPIGQSTSRTVNVTHHGTQPVAVRAQTGEYRYAFTAYTRQPTNRAFERLPSCQSWISIDPPKLPLQPGASGALTITVTVPQEAAGSPAGEYVASILIDEQPQTKEATGSGENTITVVPRIAIPLYVLLEGRQAPSGRLVGLTASRGSQPGVVRLLLTLANDGRAHLRPTGTVLLLNDRREIVHRASLGRTIPIFPQFQEGIPLWFSLTGGRYTAVATVDIGGPELLQRELAFTVAADGTVTHDK